MPQVVEESLLGRDDLRIADVVADAVAVAEAAGDTPLVRGAVVVALPVPGLLDHAAFDDLGEVRAALVDEFLLDTGQGEECLAEGEREPGADLEDRPVVLDEPGERCAGLVVGGVGFEDYRRLAVEDVLQLGGAAAVVVDDLLVVELDARLGDERADARPDVGEAHLGQGVPVGAERLAGRLGARGGELAEGLVGAAGEWSFV